MHEQGIAQEMVSVALRYGAENRARRITQMRIELSQTAHENEDSLQMYLEHMARGTMAENAAFEFERINVPPRCLACGFEFEQQTLVQVCPRCASPFVETSRVDEVRLASIEIE